jgi:tetratricopeptide (TPR) repeat protein
MEIIITEKKYDENPTTWSKHSLCLNMIVKNESKIIRRLFDSVINIIDCYCICDTGSTDDTKEVIDYYFKEKNIPGKIVEEPFVNFAHNRNVALQACKDMSDYVLLLDADMVLEIGKSFQKTSLTLDSYSLLQGSDDFYYHNMRIVKNTGNYTYVGVTHEYISTPPNNTTGNIDRTLLFIRDIGDGGSKANKFERDISLLSDAIKTEPNHDRYHFYLANSYYDSGKYIEAIDIYKKRIEIGGWNQEVWYSYYRLGTCYKNIGKIEDAISTWLNAYEYLPNRIENLYEIIQYYRIIGKCKLAKIFYDIAKDVLKTQVKHKDDYLFLNNDIYMYKLDYELSIIACYIGVHKVNDEVVAILNHSNEEHIINNTLSNMKFYKDVWTPIVEMDMSFTTSYQVGGKYRIFRSSSASIVPNGDGYLMNVRLVNYTIDEQGRYHDCDDHIISLNKCVELSKGFKVLNEKLIDSVFDERRYIGVEDVKIFKSIESGAFVYLGTGLHQNGNLGMVMGKYDKNAQVMNPTELTCSFNQSSCEKNWVFVNYENASHVVYNWFPLQLCKINTFTNSLELVKKIDMPKIFRNIRGSTCAAENNDELWFVTHIVSYEQPRHYYHLIAVFDKTMKLLRYSAPFKFGDTCIEYCLGIVVEDDRVLFTHSSWDRTTKLGVYERGYLDKFVCYTP